MSPLHPGGLDNHHQHEECAAFTTLSITTDSSTNTTTTRTQDKCIQVYPVTETCAEHVRFCHQHFMGDFIEKECEHSDHMRPISKHPRVPMSEKERQRHREQKQRLRENPAYREAERLRNMLNKRKLRADPEYRMRERIKDKERKRSKRYLEKMPDHERNLEVVLSTQEDSKLPNDLVDSDATESHNRQMQSHQSLDPSTQLADHPTQRLVTTLTIRNHESSSIGSAVQDHNEMDRLTGQIKDQNAQPIQMQECTGQPLQHQDHCSSQAIQRLKTPLSLQDHHDSAVRPMRPPIQDHLTRQIVDHQNPSQPLQMQDCHTQQQLQRNDHNTTPVSLQECPGLQRIQEQNERQPLFQDHSNLPKSRQEESCHPGSGGQDCRNIQDHSGLPSSQTIRASRQELPGQSLQTPEPCLQSLQGTTDLNINPPQDSIVIQDSHNPSLHGSHSGLNNSHRVQAMSRQNRYNSPYV